MKIIDTENPDVLVLEPCVFHDERGFFLEAWNARLQNEVKLDLQFVQDNHLGRPAMCSGACITR